MARNFSLKLSRDPRTIARIVLGTLLLANLLAAWAVFQPVGGSAEQLEEQLVAMRSQLAARTATVNRVRTLAAKVETARTGGDQFMAQYFLDRRTAFSALVGELTNAAKEAGIRPKEHSFTVDPVEGSDTLGMMTIVGNYEGSYGDLLQFVNRLDKSPRFLILDTINAAPQTTGNMLNVQIRFNAFVREAVAL